VQPNQYRTPEERRARDAQIVALLLSNPTASNRMAARTLHAGKHAIVRLRRELEQEGKIPVTSKRIGERKPQPKRQPSCKSVERCAEIERLFARGTSLTEVAAACGIGVRSLLDFMSRHKVAVPRWSRRVTKESAISVERVIHAAVGGLSAAAHGLSIVDLRRLPLTGPHARDLASELRRALPEFTRLQRALDTIIAKDTND
jgi:hypothetical protein